MLLRQVSVPTCTVSITLYYGKLTVTGLDVPEHGEEAYPKSAWGEEEKLWKPIGPSSE